MHVPGTPAAAECCAQASPGRLPARGSGMPLPAPPAVFYMQVALQRLGRFNFFAPFGRKSRRPYTLLVPTDAAFNATLLGADSLQRAALRDGLPALLLYHQVLSGGYSAAQLAARERVSTALGPSLGRDMALDVSLHGGCPACGGLHPSRDADAQPPPPLLRPAAWLQRAGEAQSSRSPAWACLGARFSLAGGRARRHVLHLRPGARQLCNRAAGGRGALAAWQAPCHAARLACTACHCCSSNVPPACSRRAARAGSRPTWPSPPPLPVPAAPGLRRSHAGC